MAERTGHPQFQALNSLIKEARHNAQVAKELGETDLNDHRGPNASEILIRHLAQQGPNRIYCGPEGQIARVFFYHGEFSYEAYMETLAPSSSHPSGFEVARGEFLSTSTPEDLEREIAHWKAKWGTGRDLLHTPEEILESETRQGEFVHRVGETFCRYHMSPLKGPYIIDLGRGNYSHSLIEVFKKHQRPNPDLIAYAHPF